MVRHEEHCLSLETSTSLPNEVHVEHVLLPVSQISCVFRGTTFLSTSVSIHTKTFANRDWMKLTLHTSFGLPITTRAFHGHFLLWTMEISLIVTWCDNWNVIFFLHVVPLTLIKKKKKRKKRYYVQQNLWGKSNE